MQDIAARDRARTLSLRGCLPIQAAVVGKRVIQLHILRRLAARDCRVADDDVEADLSDNRESAVIPSLHNSDLIRGRAAAHRTGILSLQSTIGLCDRRRIGLSLAS